MGLRDEFNRRGFVVLESVIEAERLPSLRSEADRLLDAAPEKGGARNGLNKSELFRELAFSEPLAGLARSILGTAALPVKLTIFDKTPRANWKVPWHQDLTITVRERREVPGYGPWTEKGGLPHVQPPVGLLEKIVALRVHLDETSTNNGALRVIPGSHRSGRWSDRDIRRLLTEREEVVCPVAAAGVMMMSPLLLHASSASAAPSRRRVLHFEYCGAELPGGLCWA